MKRHNNRSYGKNLNEFNESINNSTFKKNLLSTEFGIQNAIQDLSSECIEKLLHCKSTFTNQAIASLQGSSTNSNENLNNGYTNEAGKELAKCLNEPKYQLMVGVIDLVGGQVVLELFQKNSKN